MYQGLYIVFEGMDYSGKSTLAHMVREELRNMKFDCVLTQHPGATPLGKHLRKLIKTPELFDEPSSDPIEIDNMSVQMMMMVDHGCFVKTKLIPHLVKGGIMLADRSNYISCIVYGVAEGLKLTSVNKLLGLVQSPAPDRVFIISNRWETIVERMNRSTDLSKFDRYDHNVDLLKQVGDLYDNLLKLSPEALMMLSRYVPLEHIKYLNGDTPAIELAQSIAQQIVRLANEKMESNVGQ
jgi:dTMP kinase